MWRAHYDAGGGGPIIRQRPTAAVPYGKVMNAQNIENSSPPLPAAAAMPRVYIVGGGFAGLDAARALAKAPVRVTLVDRRNHHTFQPLLYQVATAALSPADIASPIRHILRKIDNCRVVLAEITGIDLERRHLIFGGGAVEYDYLILAAGATHSYFGHE